MKQTELLLPWGKGNITLQIPENWNLLGILEPSSIPPVDIPSMEVERSLNSPIGLQQLEKLATPQMKVVIVIDDISRPTPVHEIFPRVLNRLLGVGINQIKLPLFLH